MSTIKLGLTLLTGIILSCILKMILPTLNTVFLSSLSITMLVLLGYLSEKKELTKHIYLPFSNHVYIFIITTLFVASLLSLNVVNNSQSVCIWSSLNVRHWIRSILWTVCIFLVSGFLVLKILNIEDFSYLEKILFSFSLSISLFILVSLVVLFLSSDPILIPFSVIIFNIILFLYSIFSHRRSKQIKLTKPIEVTFYHLVLLSIVFTSFIGLLTVQTSLKYLIGGDSWRMIKHSVILLDSGFLPNSYNHSSLVSNTGYPLILAMFTVSFSTCTGLPLLNSYAFMHLLILILPLSFYVFASRLFPSKKKVHLLGSFFFTFGGGLGGLFHYFFDQGFWGVSNITQDLFFAYQLNNLVNLRASTLAYIFAMPSITFFLLAMDSSRRNKNCLIVFSGLLGSISFLTHYIEILFILPFIFITFYIKKKYLEGFQFIISITIFSLVIDFFNSFYELKLLIAKISEYILGSHLNLFFFLCSIISLILISLFISNKIKPFQNSILWITEKLFSNKTVLLWFISLSSWLSIFYFEILPRPNLKYQVMYLPLGFYPFMFFPTKFGVIGLLSVFFLSRKKYSNSNKLLSFSLLWSLVLSAIWWGYHTLVFGFIAICLLAAQGLLDLKYSFIIKLSFLNPFNKKCIKKSVVIRGFFILFLSLLVISSLSYASIIEEYSNSKDIVYNDDFIDTVSWIYKNTPKNTTFLLSHYEFCNFFYSMTLRPMIPTRPEVDNRYKEIYTDWEILKNTKSTLEAKQILMKWNVTYVCVLNPFSENMYSSMNSLLEEAKIIHQEGEITVYKISER